MNVQSSGQRSAVKLMNKKILVAAGTQSTAFDSRDFVGSLDAVIYSDGDNGDGGATIVFSFETSADNTTYVTYAGAPTPITVTAASATNTCAIDTRATGCLRYIRFKALTASTTATFNVAAVAHGTKQVQ